MINMLIACNDSVLSNFLVVVKRVLFLIEVIIPILLIVFGCFSFVKLIRNPDEKNGIKKVINQFLAAAIIFFIPLFINILMSVIGEKTNFSSCWIESGSVIKKVDKYYKNSSEKKKQIFKDTKGYEKGDKRVTPGNLYGEAVACRALNLASSAIGTNYLTKADANKVGCTLNSDGRLKVPKGEHSHKYRAELPQTANIIKFWDEEKALGKWGLGTYGPASCSPWIGSLLRSMGYDDNIATAEAANAGLVSPWTGERLYNSISAHGIGTYMYHHPESFEHIIVDSNKSIAEQCQPGDILTHSKHILIFVGNDLAQKAFPKTTGDSVEAAENGRCYPGVTAAGRGNVGSYKVFRVKKAATNYNY